MNTGKVVVRLQSGFIEYDTYPSAQVSQETPDMFMM
jgi:hypothetical protein